MTWRLVRIGLSIFLLCAASAGSTLSHARENFAPVRAAAAAALRSDESGLIGAPAPALIDLWRMALHHWIEARFDRLGRAAPRGLAAIGHRLDRGFNLDAIPLGSSSYLIAAGKWGFGTVFVIRRERRRYRTLWAAPGATSSGRAFLSLESWTSGASIGLCPARPHCTPLSADRIGTLPAGSNGRPRFYVQATYRSEIGFTVGGQLSIWEWDGSAARPLLVRDFDYMLAQSAPIAGVNGAMLTLHIKGEFEHFYACGQCEGRQMAWRFRAGRRGIVDLGRRSLLPEVDLVDHVVDRLLRGQDVSSLSGRAPAEFLRRAIAENGRPPSQSRPGEPVYLGMVMAWRVKGARTRHELCLWTDALAARFTIIGAAGRYRLVAVRSVQTREPCRGAGSHM